MSRRKVKKTLRAAAAELLIIASELAVRPRGLSLSAEEARELADRIRQVAGDIAIVAYELKEGEEWVE